MALAQVRKDNFVPSRPWVVQIWKDEVRGIRGGVEGPWKTRKAAQAWADEFNRIHKLVRK